MTTLTGQQIADAGLDGWAQLLRGLQTRIRLPHYAVGLELVAAIGAVAEELDHHPDLDLRYDHLDVRLSSHDEDGVTQRDVRLARRVAALAAEAGVALSAGPTSRIELAIDSPDPAALRPFWTALLNGTSAAQEDEVRDASGAFPTLWFQPSGATEPRQHWHPDVWLDPSEVPGRIDAALAAGGRLVYDDEAPAFWVLADPEGNRVCLCTWQDRD